MAESRRSSSVTTPRRDTTLGKHHHWADSMADSIVKLSLSSTPPTDYLFPIKAVCVSNAGILDNGYVDGRSNGECSPLFRKYGCPDDFLFLNFEDVRADDVLKVLQQGISTDDGHFLYFGQRVNQLRFRQCYMFKETLGDINEILNSFGEFDSFESVSLKAARIGLLVSLSTQVADLCDSEIRRANDIVHNQYNFTNGCGFISLALCEKITESLNIAWMFNKQEQKVPSVFQVRVNGCKGVLLLSVDRPKDTYITVRPSMEKFKWTMKAPHTLGVVLGGKCGYSRPNTYGRLNKQFITLLSARGIRDDVFVKLQKEYFEELNRLPLCESLQVKHLSASCQEDEVSLSELILKGKEKQTSSEAFRLTNRIMKLCNWAKRVPQTYGGTKKKSPAERLVIPVGKSRCVYGVADPTESLDYGQCFFQPTIRGSPQFLTCCVIVSKNPCYHPGDVRVLECVDRKECRHLHDCIVFPVKGERPHSDEISGSDMDGDIFFVCWDEELIPSEPFRPSKCEDEPPVKKQGAIEHRHLAKHFADYQYTNVHHLYERWVDREGPKSDECIALADVFKTAIDAAKTGRVVKIPPWLHQPRTLVRKFPLWQKLHKQAQSYLKEGIKNIVDSMDSDGHSQFMDYEDMLELVSNQDTGLDDLQLFRLVLIWCKRHENRMSSLLKLTKHIRFSRLLPNQRHVSCIDIAANLHGYFQDMPGEYKISIEKQVGNALYQSDALNDEDVQKITGKETYRWLLHYKMQEDELFPLTILHQVLEEDVVKLLVFKLFSGNTEWVVAINIAGQIVQKKPRPAGKCMVFSSRHVGTDQALTMHPRNPKMVSLSREYFISIMGNKLAIYAGNKTNTFVHLAFDREEAVISVALNKFDNRYLDENGDARIQKCTVTLFEVFTLSRYPHEKSVPYAGQ